MVLLAACGGEPERVVPGIAAARAERTITDGVAQLASTVTVRFDRNFVIVEERLPISSLFELEVSGVDGARQRVLVKAAEQSRDNARIFTLKVDTLVPDGSTLKVRRSAFRKGEEGDLSSTVASDVSAAQAVLASMAFASTRADLFDGTQELPVRDADRDEAVQRAALERHLDLRGGSDEARQRVLDAFDTISPEVVVSPKLRAALAALTGTFAEPAITSLLTDGNCTGMPAQRIAFEEPPDYPELFARVTHTEEGARIVSISPRLEGEPFERLMPLMTHEAVHCDDKDGLFEEIAATAFDSLLYSQLLTLDPAIVEGGTLLARDLNADALAMFNSGRLAPESLGILPSIGVTQALPFTNQPSASFAEFVADAYPQVTATQSPDEALAQAYVDVLRGLLGLPAGSAFDLVYLDALIGAVADQALIVAVIGALELSPAP